MAGILGAMLRRLTTLAGLCWVVLVLGACPQARRTPPPDASGAPDDGQHRPASGAEPEDRGDAASTISDGRTGVEIALPDGWTARSGPGDVVATAWEPASDAVRVQIRRWDGDPSALEALMARDPWSWSAPGPYAAIPVADGDPVVTVWREGDAPSPAEEWIVFGWFFLVHGEGVGFVAHVPVSRIEEGWRTATSILATVTVGGHP